MTVTGWTQIVLFLIVVAALARPIGLYMLAVFEGRKTLFSPVLVPVENGFYRLSGIDSAKEQRYGGAKADIERHSRANPLTSAPSSAKAPPMNATAITSAMDQAPDSPA